MVSGAVDIPLEYVRLGLRFDRLEEGFVDAYTGDRRIRAAVADEPAPTPLGLRDQARGLLRELDSTDLPADRVAHLRGQLTALECTARTMAGDPVGYREEVRAYFQVDGEYLGKIDQLEARLHPSRLPVILPDPESLAPKLNK